MSEKTDKNTLISQSFNEFLKDWFKKSALTQVKAAEKLGMSQGVFNNLLRLKKGVSFLQIEEIANKLGEDPIALLKKGQSLLEGAEPPKDGENRPGRVVSEAELTSEAGSEIPARVAPESEETMILREELARLKDENLNLYRELAEHKREMAAAGRIKLDKAAGEE